MILALVASKGSIVPVEPIPREPKQFNMVLTNFSEDGTIFLDGKTFNTESLRQQGLMLEHEGELYLDVTNFPLPYARPRGSWIERIQPGNYLNRVHIIKRQQIRGEFDLHLDGHELIPEAVVNINPIVYASGLLGFIQKSVDKLKKRK